MPFYRSSIIYSLPYLCWIFLVIEQICSWHFEIWIYKHARVIKWKNSRTIKYSSLTQRERILLFFINQHCSVQNLNNFRSLSCLAKGPKGSQSWLRIIISAEFLEVQSTEEQCKRFDIWNHLNTVYKLRHERRGK